MQLSVFAAWAHGLLAVVFLVAAGWKLTHQRAFRAAVGQLAPRSKWLPAALPGYGVPAVEATLGVLVLVPGRTGQLASLAAAGVLVAFTFVLARAEPTADCGCWLDADVETSPKVQQTAGLLRNAALIGAAIVGASTGVGSAEWTAFGLVAGGAFGLLIMEIPQIAAVATFTRAREGGKA